MNRLILKIVCLTVVFSLVSCSSSKNIKDRRSSRKVVATTAKKERPSAKPVISPNSRTTSSSSSPRSSLVESAESLLGTPYKYGGKDSRGLDCSGLVRYVYSEAGYKLTGSSKYLAKQGKSIDKSQAKAGDLMFFHKNGEVFHVSLIVENKRNDLWVVHSTSSKGVIKENIFASPYWNKKSFSLRQIVN